MALAPVVLTPLVTWFVLGALVIAIGLTAVAVMKHQDEKQHRMSRKWLYENRRRDEDMS
jgi:multisubunit Na+/H+ antiporter MnhC subunit